MLTNVMTQILVCVPLLFGLTHAEQYEMGRLRRLQWLSRRGHPDNHAVLPKKISPSTDKDFGLSRNVMEIQRLVRE
jgi:hypothetical protein